MENKQRTVFISDVHGCVEEFSELLKLVDAKSPNVRVICLGDFLDRGVDSTACIRLAREMKLESVRGNHEQRFLQWLPHKSPNKGKDFYSKLSDQDIQYITNMPLYIELDDIIAVHAGVKPNIPMPYQSKDDLMYLRYTDKDRKFISLRQINKLGIEATGAKFWTSFGPFGKNLVYGHNVYSLTEPRIDRFEDGTTTYGIDCGAVFGGRLTALIWETREIVQVQAKRVYYQSKF